MKPQKTLQFIVGCAVIYFAWQLASAGWFDRIPSIFRSYGTEGFSGGASDLLLDVLPYLVDTICLFGSVAIAVYGFLWKAIKPVSLKLLRLLDLKLEEKGIDLFEFDQEPVRKDDLDVRELESVLQSIVNRLDAIENKGEEDGSKPEQEGE